MAKKLLFILLLTLWPSTVDEAMLLPIQEYTLPHDIMTVIFKNETWTYRLYSSGRIRKLISIKEGEWDYEKARKEARDEDNAERAALQEEKCTSEPEVPPVEETEGGDGEGWLETDDGVPLKEGEFEGVEVPPL